MDNPFHLAIPVDNLELAAQFYGDVLGCEQGRSDSQWIDWNFYGHQLVTHLVSEMPQQPAHNPVDGKHVPVPHFGVVLSMATWHDVVERLRKVDTQFVIEPYLRFSGQPGEQATCFLHDPAGNALEFKAFNNKDMLFAT